MLINHYNALLNNAGELIQLLSNYSYNCHLHISITAFSGTLRHHNGIEVAHVFHLNEKYSGAMEAKYKATNGTVVV